MTAQFFLWKHASAPRALPWCCRCLVYRKDSVLRADCQKSQPKGPDRRHHVCMSANEFVNMAQTMLGVTTCDENVTKVGRKRWRRRCRRGWLSRRWLLRRWRRRWRRGWLSRRWRGDGEGDGSQGDGEGDGSQGDGDGEQCSGQIQTFAIQIFVREFQVVVGTAFLRLPKVCLEQILLERRGKYDKINKFLVNNDLVWQQFVANESLSLTPPVNESFPSLPDAILYGALSEPVHQPPGACCA